MTQLMVQHLLKLAVAGLIDDIDIECWFVIFFRHDAQALLAAGGHILDMAGTRVRLSGSPRHADDTPDCRLSGSMFDVSSSPQLDIFCCSKPPAVQSISDCHSGGIASPA